jgi:hypothetical protein
MEQLQKIFEDEKKADQGSSAVQEEVEDGNEVLNPDITRSVKSIVLNTINNQFQHECLDGVVRLLNVHPIHQSTDYSIPGNKYSTPSLPGFKFLTRQVWAIWFIMRR